jgi:tricorn protease-like protein
MKPDLGLIVAVQRNQTGANIHKLNNLLNQYVCACHTENDKLAERAKHELIAVAIEREWKQAAPVKR